MRPQVINMPMGASLFLAFVVAQASNETTWSKGTPNVHVVTSGEVKPPKFPDLEFGDGMFEMKYENVTALLHGITFR